jgi:uncharacterized membrane protein YbhN (UPF0104 family)
MTRRWRHGLGPLTGAAVMALLVSRFGADAVLDGFRRLDVTSVAVALVVGLVTTVAAAWRWTVVADGIGLSVRLPAAVAAYYRSQLVNVTVPGGIAGDVERTVRQGRGRRGLVVAARSVGWERFGGQAVQVVVTAAVLLAVPSAFRTVAGWGATGLLALLAVLVVGWLVGSRSGHGRLSRAVRGTGADLHAALLTRRALPRVVAASVVVVAGHAAVVGAAARATGVDLGLGALAPLALVVLAGSAVPLNVAGWGPREGVAAWAFAASGLGASAGVTAASAYGALVLVAALPGVVVVVGQTVRERRSARQPEPVDADA